MKVAVIVFFCLGIFCISSNAQTRIDVKEMNYLILSKPNNILYNDTLYKGSAQFQKLFFRSHNFEIMEYYRKHQSNKISGQLIGVMGVLATVFGINHVTSNQTEKEKGWILIGTGFAASIAGGYLTLMGQRNLMMAVTLFNQQHNKAGLGLGISNAGAGLVLKF